MQFQPTFSFLCMKLKYSTMYEMYAVLTLSSVVEVECRNKICVQQTSNVDVMNLIFLS